MGQKGTTCKSSKRNCWVIVCCYISTMKVLVLAALVSIATADPAVPFTAFASSPLLAHAPAAAPLVHAVHAPLVHHSVHAPVIHHAVHAPLVHHSVHAPIHHAVVHHAPAYHSPIPAYHAPAP